MTRYENFINLARRALLVGRDATAAETLGRAFQMALETPEGPHKRKMCRICSLVRDRIRRATYVYHGRMEGFIEKPWEWEDWVKGIGRAPTDRRAGDQ